MKKALWFVVCCFIGAFYACDDSTSNIGMEVVPDADQVTITGTAYDVNVKTLLVDSVLARTSTCYLGNYTDPETGTSIHSDFLAQFYCPEGFEYPEDVIGDEAFYTDLRLYVDNWVGDSLAPCRVSVYPLTKSLDNSASYYTNINPADYYDEAAGPIATKTFTLSDRQLTDSARYDKYNYRNIRITLPTSVGTDIIKKFKTNPEYFKNAEQFEKNVCKGYYVKFEKGEGVMANIYVTQLNTHFRYNEVRKSTGLRDSVVTSIATFSATEEVIQANVIKHQNLEKLINDTEAAHIKTPSGLFAELTLPLKEISTNDTINSAKLTIDRYYTPSETDYKIPAPKTMLMIRKKDLETFFTKNRVPDNETAFIANYSKDTKYTYIYNNISHLISYIRNERNKGLKSDPNWEANNPDWNKVVLLPVVATYNSSTTPTVIAINHDLSISYTKIRNKDVKLQVIYSKFNQ